MGANVCFWPCKPWKPKPKLSLIGGMQYCCKIVESLGQHTAFQKHPKTRPKHSMHLGLPWGVNLGGDARQQTTHMQSQTKVERLRIFRELIRPWGGFEDAAIGRPRSLDGRRTPVVRKRVVLSSLAIAFSGTTGPGQSPANNNGRVKKTTDPIWERCRCLVDTWVVHLHRPRSRLAPGTRFRCA